MSTLAFATQVLSILSTILVPGIAFIVVLKRGWLRALERPIDRGVLFRGEPLFGRSKTWLGVLVYGLGAAAIGLCLSSDSLAGWVAPIFTGPAPRGALVGLAIGLAYAAAELVNSFVKRRLRLGSSAVTPGRWRPVQAFFDLGDGIIAVLVVIILLGTDVLLAVVAAACGLLVHALTDAWMRRLRLKRSTPAVREPS